MRPAIANQAEDRGFVLLVVLMEDAAELATLVNNKMLTFFIASVGRARGASGDELGSDLADTLQTTEIEIGFESRKQVLDVGCHGVIKGGD